MDVGMTVSELWLKDGTIQQSGGWIGPDYRLSWCRNVYDHSVDIHWGDFWTVRTALFKEMGHLPTEYGLGYWECVELGTYVRMAGHRVVTSPGSRVTHLKSQTFHRALSPAERDTLFERNRSIFAQRWQRFGERIWAGAPRSTDKSEWR
jgi:GT2 family glycosyltransferase